MVAVAVDCEDETTATFLAADAETDSRPILDDTTFDSMMDRCRELYPPEEVMMDGIWMECTTTPN